MNYNIFDSFLKVDTWHTLHDSDLKRFYECLKPVVLDPDFNPESMGEYFRTEKGATDSEHPYFDTVSSLVEKAWAVRDFLNMTGTVIADA